MVTFSRHMRTCKAPLPEGEASPPLNQSRHNERGNESTASEPSPTLSRSSSPYIHPTETSIQNYLRTPSSPTQSNSTRRSSQQIRGVSPDPSWGPIPLAGWKAPRIRRHSSAQATTAFRPPVPISQRIYVEDSSAYTLPGYLMPSRPEAMMRSETWSSSTTLWSSTNSVIPNSTSDVVGGSTDLLNINSNTVDPAAYTPKHTHHPEHSMYLIPAFARQVTSTAEVAAAALADGSYHYQASQSQHKE